MYKVLLIIFAFSLTYCSRQKENISKNKSIHSETPTRKTTFDVNEDIHDFGILKSGEIAISTFVITNTGEDDLVIRDIKTDCGCVQIKFPKEPVKPGKNGLIEVQFNSSGLYGKQFKSMEIYANTKELKHLAIFATVNNENLDIKY